MSVMNGGMITAVIEVGIVIELFRILGAPAWCGLMGGRDFV